MQCQNLTNSFQFNPQLNILLYSQNNLKLMEVPLDWTNSEDMSKIIGLKYSFQLLKILLYFPFAKTILNKTVWQLFHSEPQDFDPQYQLL